MSKFVDYVWRLLEDSTYVICHRCLLGEVCAKNELWCRKAIREALEASKWQ